MTTSKISFYITRVGHKEPGVAIEAIDSEAAARKWFSTQKCRDMEVRLRIFSKEKTEYFKVSLNPAFLGAAIEWAPGEPKLKTDDFIDVECIV